MADVKSAQDRSRNMAAIRGADTKPELRLRRALHASGFRFRLHTRDVPGRPDLLLPRYRAAIFVHGCFWHRHPGCRYTTTPSTRVDFWKAKFDENVRRDARVVAELVGAGWRVAVVWECGLRGDRIKCTLPSLTEWLKSADPGPKSFPAIGLETADPPTLKRG